MAEKDEKLPVSAYIGFALLVAYVILIIIVRINIPDAETVIRIVTDLYQRFGYGIVFFSGIIEAMFLLGLYFPGSAAILLGAVVARSGAVFLPLIIFFGTLGILIGYVINYFMGKHGWYHALARFGLEQSILETEKKLKKHGTKAFFVAYISPNSGSLISTAAGVMQMPFQKFLLISIACQAFWSTVWAVVAYLIGPVFVELFLKYFTYIIWVIIAFWLLRRYFQGKR